MPERDLFDGGLLDVPDADVARLLDGLRGRQDRVDAALEVAGELAAVTPLPGRGATLRLWDLLSRLGALDLTMARTLEPHLDAHAILDAAGRPDLGAIGADGASTWGVYAAEGPGGRLTASAADDGAWRLNGHKPWCSLAGRLSHALVTAWTGERTRRLFAIALDPAHATPDAADGWQALGLRDVPSVGVTFDAAPAVPVGDDGWYLDRPGFAWGGMGVAACWYGGAAAVAARLRPRPGGREPDQVALMHLGTADATLYAARSVLRDAAAAVDAGEAHAVTAYRVRHVVARTCDDLLDRTARATGPAPLALDAEHARRVVDLGLYVRQEHAERDSAALGDALVHAPADAPVDAPHDRARQPEPAR